MISHADSLREAEQKARAILREDAPRTPAEQAALDAVNKDPWILWHANDHNLGVIRLLSRARLLRDPQYEAEQERGLQVNADLAARDRERNSVLINALTQIIDQAVTELGKGQNPTHVAAWMRSAGHAAWATRDRREDTADG